MRYIVNRLTPLYMSTNGSMLPAAVNDANMMIMASPEGWTSCDDPALGARASATLPAVAGKKHVVTSISASLASSAINGTVVKLYLREGLSDVGTIKWVLSLNLGVNTNAIVQALDGVAIPILKETPVTLEFSAPLAGVQQNVSFTGYTV